MKKIIAIIVLIIFVSLSILLYMYKNNHESAVVKILSSHTLRKIRHQEKEIDQSNYEIMDKILLNKVHKVKIFEDKEDLSEELKSIYTNSQVSKNVDIIENEFSAIFESDYQYIKDENNKDEIEITKKTNDVFYFFDSEDSYKLSLLKANLYRLEDQNYGKFYLKLGLELCTKVDSKIAFIRENSDQSFLRLNVFTNKYKKDEAIYCNINAGYFKEEAEALKFCKNLLKKKISCVVEKNTLK
jgi:hypothetical protein